MTTNHAFDPLAATYDAAFTDTIIGRYLRDQVQARLAQHFNAGDHVLELGCGTGEDALWLAQRGVRVIATDASPRMLAVAQAKCAAQPTVRVEPLDLQQLSSDSNPNFSLSTSPFDGVYSSFGPLNCLTEWRELAEWLAQRVKPGGIIGLGVMSPFCLWEPLWHGLHGTLRIATRRWRRSTRFQPDDNATPITVTYPTLRRLNRDFAPHFRPVYVRPLGLFLPPSDVFGVIEKRPRLLRLLLSLEQRFGHVRQLALLADHYWVEYQKT